jgi:clan AA aspartic protease (TIGR02281 family)
VKVGPTPPSAGSVSSDSVPITMRDGSIIVDVTLGNRQTRMVLDTGASYTAITMSLARNLVESYQARWLDKGQSIMADGRVVDTWAIVIKEVRIGNHVLYDVPAMVNTSDTSMLLFGLGTLNKIGSFTIDTRQGLLIFNPSA